MSKKSKRHPEHEEHADESWLLPYSDLMTLLLAMFIVLFGMSNVDSQKFQQLSEAFNSVLTGGKGVLDHNSMINKNDNTSMVTEDVTRALNKKMNDLKRQEEENLEALKKRLDTYIEKNGLTDQLDTKLNQSQLMITISDIALFPSGEAEVKPEARILAKEIAKMLEEFPDYEVFVSGHTDNVPISTNKFRDNWDLSSVRALNFMKILLLNDKLDPKMFIATGNGEYRPVASNDTNVGRAQNRRVEVSIIRKYQDSDFIEVKPVQ